MESVRASGVGECHAEDTREPLLQFTAAFSDSDATYLTTRRSCGEILNPSSDSPLEIRRPRLGVET
jgi:hypothetical protein